MLGIMISCLFVFLLARPSLKWWAQLPIAIFVGVAVSIAVPFILHIINPEDLSPRGVAIHAIQHLLLNVGGSVIFLGFLKLHYRKSSKQKDVS